MIGLVDLDLIDGIDVGHVGRYFSRYPCGVPSRGDWTIHQWARQCSVIIGRAWRVGGIGIVRACY